MQMIGQSDEPSGESAVVKNENESFDTGELCSNILERCRRAESVQEAKEGTCSGAARFARRELDYIAEMYCSNYEIFHKSSLGGGRAKEAILLKRKLLQEMADYLSTVAEEKRTVMQIDQKIRDEIRQVKKYLRYKRQNCFGKGGSREIRLSSSQQYIADRLKLKPRLSKLCGDLNPKSTQGSAGLLSIIGELQNDRVASCSNTDCPPSLSFPADTTSFAEQTSHALDSTMCSYSEQRTGALDLTTETVEELRKKALCIEIDCARARTEAAIEERRYWEEKRSLLALERQLVLVRHHTNCDLDSAKDRLTAALRERQYWEERRRIVTLKRQCMINQLE
ncbi:unnamed protein product [Angiostrongylus costaricensis]|uniref:Uncharacterized protein n=1 Tax=Angiostrongylus costaricensis TaxID=334426 RepID=A0A0R3PJH9_ANGCS|nr:unnamed protein product [Angiostrongylus costaricensis]